MRIANDTSVDLWSNKDGDLCEQVGTTAAGRKIWRWRRPAVTAAAPMELVFTNHDLLTCIMPFANGGYYNYDHLVYKAGQDATSLTPLKSPDSDGTEFYDLQGCRIGQKPTAKGIYFVGGKLTIIR